jgi:hypothetical protein
MVILYPISYILIIENITRTTVRDLRGAENGVFRIGELAASVALCFSKALEAIRIGLRCNSSLRRPHPVAISKFLPLIDEWRWNGYVIFLSFLFHF